MFFIKRLLNKDPQVIQTSRGQLKGFLEVLVDKNEQVGRLLVVDDWMVV